MSNSPAWDDINPAPPARKPSGLLEFRAIANRVRQKTDFAVQLIHEGQLDRARDYLDQAMTTLEELK